MSAIATAITVFQPNSRKREVTIESLIPQQTVDALEEKLGQEAADKARKALRHMKANDVDLLQIRHGDRRIRISQTA
jgi:hypothetical protein